MAEKGKNHQEIPKKGSYFYLRETLVIVMTLLLFTLPVSGTAFGVQSLIRNKGEEVARGVWVDGVREFRISASQWNFKPGIIQVNPGDRVRFVIGSTDLMHGFRIDELGINLYLPTDREVIHEVVIPPDMAEGTYGMHCYVCGAIGGHPEMKGSLIVGNPRVGRG